MREMKIKKEEDSGKRRRQQVERERERDRGRQRRGRYAVGREEDSEKAFSVEKMANSKEYLK